VAIEVADDGCGMTPEQVSHIFEPFYTTKGALGGSTTPGTGLGLSVSYNLVKRHGGEIEVTSTPGEGTLVRVVLPVAGGGGARAVDEPAAVAVAAPAPKVAPTASASDGAPLAILVAEDDPALQMVYRQVLGGEALELVGDSESALEALARGGWDVVVLDLIMPGNASGLDVLEAALASSPRPDRIVVATGEVSEESLAQAAARADRLLVKPFGISQLAEAVGRPLRAQGEEPGSRDGPESG
jgi:CheY-like chemotaxis protein